MQATKLRANRIHCNPFLSLIRAGGRERNSTAPFSSQHPFILHGNIPITRLVVRSEHLRLLHAGPTLLTWSHITFSSLLFLHCMCTQQSIHPNYSTKTVTITRTRHLRQHYDDLYRHIIQVFEHTRMCDKHANDVSLHTYIDRYIDGYIHRYS